VADESGRRPGGLLSSWKEIAAHLGVNVRTAQKWEAERGLPVRRLPGGRGRVMASVEELDAWLEAPRNAETLPAAGAAGGRRSLARTGILAGAFLLALVAAAALNVFPGRVPAGWRVVGDVLVVVDVHGRELWTKQFGYALSDYQRLSALTRNMGWVGDLDSDGEPEVLFLAHPKAGEIRWSTATRVPAMFAGPFNPGRRLMVFRTSSGPRTMRRTCLCFACGAR
jgi:hypothetical protein